MLTHNLPSFRHDYRPDMSTTIVSLEKLANNLAWNSSESPRLAEQAQGELRELLWRYESDAGRNM